MGIKKQERILIFIVLIISAILLGLDVVDDLSHGSSLLHVLEEGVIVLFCVIGLLVLVKRYFLSKEENIIMRQSLKKVQNDLNDYKKQTEHLVKGLSLKIDEQMVKWGFTSAEKEVCMLLLKGLSIKEISDVRETSEKTIKQQLNAIYQKSNLSGRAELSAFFLEDLFVL